MMRLLTTISAGALLTVAGVAPRPASALPLEEKEWTVISLLSAEYPDMTLRFADTGSSADVYVVILHDVDANGMVSYRMLPDENADHHPPGRCCPEPETDCCKSEPLALTDMGISESSYIFDTDVLERFLSYVQTNFPARHYLLALRGQMTGPRFLLHDRDREGGIDIVAFTSILNAFVRRNGGKKIDVINFGFCLGMSVDWAYALAPYADYFVGSANYTNTPVAMRWRIYRWARDLIVDPRLSGGELSRKIVENFLEQTDYCEQADHHCSNAPEEPYTCVAVDLSRMDEVAYAAKDVMCELLKNPAGLGGAYEAALAQTLIYGKGDASNKRPDLTDFFSNLQQQLDDAKAKASIDAFLAAVAGSIAYGGGEAGYFGPTASGIAGYFTTTDSLREQFGPYQIDSMWKLFMDATAGSYTEPRVTGVAIVPEAIDATRGDDVTITVRTESSQYGHMCVADAAEVAWAANLDAVGALSDAAGNPTVFSALQAGTGTITATYSGMSDEITVSVRAAPPPGGNSDDLPAANADDAPPPGSGGGSLSNAAAGGGCSQQGRGGTLPVLALLALIAAPRASRRSHGRGG